MCVRCATQARIRAFSFHPEVVGRIISWAKAPYFSNADEQSILNDVLTSAISGEPCYIFSTAIMELKYGGARGKVRWEQTPEATLKPKLMTLVRAVRVRARVWVRVWVRARVRARARVRVIRSAQTHAGGPRVRCRRSSLRPHTHACVQRESGSEAVSVGVFW